jgi:hypothetical protein
MLRLHSKRPAPCKTLLPSDKNWPSSAHAIRENVDLALILSPSSPYRLTSNAAVVLRVVIVARNTREHRSNATR